MSTPETPETPATTAPQAKSKPVSIERTVVRGVIGILLLLVAIEGFSYLRVMNTHRRLSAELQKADEEHHIITREIVNEIFNQRQPDASKTVKAPVGEERYDIYYFSSLLKRRELYIHYGIPGLKNEPEVIEITTIIPDELLAN
jgi:hypothetical protein